MHNIRLPKQSTVGDVIHELKSKVFIFYAAVFFVEFPKSCAVLEL